MDIVETRRANLRRWVAKHGTPVKEKSLFSQLKANGSFGERVARRLETQYKMGAGWLDQQNAEVAATAFDVNAKPVAMGSRAIPVISAIQAGKMKEIAQPYAVGDGFAAIYVDDGYSPWVFALEIEGDSMTPDYQEGDLVIIEPEWAPRPGECVAARNGHEEATFKKYRQRGIDADGNDIFELVPLNENYPTVRSDETPLRIIGVMAEHRRKARRR
ncbi:MAG: S24 family peptidase [Pseudomonadota bacterium]|nr:S24 family peptidase [Pseudomonadota bacterium]